LSTVSSKACARCQTRSFRKSCMTQLAAEERQVRHRYPAIRRTAFHRCAATPPWRNNSQPENEKTES
jgi:hypothetical protein